MLRSSTGRILTIGVVSLVTAFFYTMLWGVHEMLVSLGIATYNRSAWLRRLLESVTELDVVPGVSIEVIVIDNNSSDATQDVVNEFTRRLQIYSVKEMRQGLSFARNKAIDLAAGDLICFLDDDLTLRNGWLSAYIDALASSPGAAFAAGAVLPAFETSPPRWVRNNLEHLHGVFSLVQPDDNVRPIGPYECPLGGNICYRASVLRMHEFNTSLGRAGSSLIGGEDTEFTKSVRSRGHSGVWAGKAAVDHWIFTKQMSISYLCRWFFSSGQTAARINWPELKDRRDVASNPFNAIKSLLIDMDPLWWSSFFSGPFWLRALKLNRYYAGFQSEVMRLHGDAAPSRDER